MCGAVRFNWVGAVVEVDHDCQVVSPNVAIRDFSQQMYNGIDG